VDDASNELLLWIVLEGGSSRSSSSPNTSRNGFRDCGRCVVGDAGIRGAAAGNGGIWEARLRNGLFEPNWPVFGFLSVLQKTNCLLVWGISW